LGGLQPAEGLIALSDAQGNVRWDNLRIPTLNISSTYAVAGSLVLLNNVYFSLIPGAEESIFLSPLLGRIFLQEALMHQSFKIR
jgi:hypothetical protein